MVAAMFPFWALPRSSVLVLAIALLGSHGATAEAADAPLVLRPRPPVLKPAAVAVGDTFEPLQLIVKFRDGGRFRAVDGRLTNDVPEEWGPVQPIVESLPKAFWRRVDRIPEAQMESLRQNAQRNLGRSLPNLNQQFRAFLPASTNAAPVIDALNALDLVELAQLVPRPAPLPVAPDFRPLQGYLDPPPTGVGAECTATNCNLRGRP